MTFGACLKLRTPKRQRKINKSQHTKLSGRKKRRNPRKTVEEKIPKKYQQKNAKQKANARCNFLAGSKNLRKQPKRAAAQAGGWNILDVSPSVGGPVLGVVRGRQLQP